MTPTDDQSSSRAKRKTPKPARENLYVCTNPPVGPEARGRSEDHAQSIPRWSLLHDLGRALLCGNASSRYLSPIRHLWTSVIPSKWRLLCESTPSMDGRLGIAVRILLP